MIGIDFNLSCAASPPDVRKVYDSCNKSSEIVEVSVNDWKLVRRIPARAGVYNLGITHDGTRLLATNKRDQSVSIYDLKSSKEIMFRDRVEGTSLMRRHLFMKTVVMIAVVLFSCPSFRAQPANPNLDSLKFLIGKWVGEGSAEVGTGSGYFTFERSLQGKVLIRKNYAEYPATNDRPAYIHEDVMIVYVDAATKEVKAFYTDSEGHVINYAVSASPDLRRFVFLSDAHASAPRYRLTYTITRPDKMSLTVEMAPPNTPDQFQKIVEGEVRRSS